MNWWKRRLRHIPEAEESAFHRRTQRGFDWMIREYDRLLEWVLDRQPLTLLIALATLALTVPLPTATLQSPPDGCGGHT